MALIRSVILAKSDPGCCSLAGNFAVARATPRAVWSMFISAAAVAAAVLCHN